MTWRTFITSFTPRVNRELLRRLRIANKARLAFQALVYQQVLSRLTFTGCLSTLRFTCRSYCTRLARLASMRCVCTNRAEVVFRAKLLHHDSTYKSAVLARRAQHGCSTSSWAEISIRAWLREPVVSTLGTIVVLWTQLAVLD